MSVTREDHNDAVYFVGPEVETTPVNGMKTLFVVGVRSIPQMISLAREYECKHIYLGANKSYQNNKTWGDIIPALLGEGFYVSLDYPVSSHQTVMEILPLEVRGHQRFIPMVSCEIPHIESFRNLTVKIDDSDFNHTNRGVWCLSVRDILDSNRFTGWEEYGHDKVVMRDDDIKELRKNPKKKIKAD